MACFCARCSSVSVAANVERGTRHDPAHAVVCERHPWAWRLLARSVDVPLVVHDELPCYVQLYIAAVYVCVPLVLSVCMIYFIDV